MSTLPPKVRRVLRWLRGLAAVAVSICALAGGVRLIVPATAGQAQEPAGQRSPALREARWALAWLDSPAGRAPFSPDLDPPYGVFYSGWTNWLLGGVLDLQPAGHRDPAELRRFARESAVLGRAFDASASPIPAVGRRPRGRT